MSLMNDHIKINGLSLVAPLSVSPWPTLDPPATTKVQPIFVSLDITLDISAAGINDDLSHSINYSEFSKVAENICTRRSSSHTNPITALGLAEEILEQCQASIFLPNQELSVHLELPKAVLRAKNASVLISRRIDGSLSKSIDFSIKGLLAHTIVGINPQEREDKQPVIIDVTLSSGNNFPREYHFPFAKLERSLSTAIEASSFLTVEALAHDVARAGLRCLEDGNLFSITISLSKPAALRLVEAPEIVITRSLGDFNEDEALQKGEASHGRHLAALALGSNLGDRFHNIERALQSLESLPQSTHSTTSGTLDVIDTSFMYETAPMYVVDQPSFINCACLVETTLSPIDLLKLCKSVEDLVGREPGIRFGPRVVDVDIITYEDQVIDTRQEKERESLDNLIGELVIPHPRMAEREFVLRPLADIIPEWVHPRHKLPVRSLLSKLVLAKSAKDLPMHKVIPFPACDTNIHDIHSTSTYWTIPETASDKANSPWHKKLGRTRIMATLNYTPDSFSDGGLNNSKEAALRYVSNAVESGADIIDIGGYSTRPGAAVVSEEEENRRVVEAIHCIRESTEERVKSILISVDSFRPSVVCAAIAAGANCVNDVYALHGPDYPPTAESDKCFQEMRAIACQHRVPVIMMHSRGEAGSNKDYSSYTSPRGLSVLSGVQNELASKVLRATKGKGSLHRWQVIVDPGIGFSKTVDGNLELLCNAAALTANATVQLSANVAGLAKFPNATPGWNPLAGFPVLIGTSRKSFLGEIVAWSRQGNGDDTNERQQSRPASERDFATAAAVACAVQQNVALVRVHEVRGMADVVKVSEALW